MKDNGSNTGRSRRKFVLTSNFALYVVLLIGALIFTQALRSRASNILFSFAFFLPLGSLIYVLTARAALKVQMLTESAEVTKKQPYEYKIRLINEWIIPYPFVDAMLYLPERDSVRCARRTVKLAMSPRADYTVNNTVRFPFRGQYSIGVDCLYVYDFFRMFRLRIDVGETETVSVLPRRLHTDISQAGAVSDSARKSRKAPNSYEKIEISDIREYRNGDPLKSIHWKLSSKSEDFMVKNYDSGTSRETFVFCDMAEHFPRQAPETPKMSETAPRVLAQDGGSEAAGATVGGAAGVTTGVTTGNPTGTTSDVPSGDVDADADAQEKRPRGKGMARVARAAAAAAQKAAQKSAQKAEEAAAATASAAFDPDRLANDADYIDMNEFCADGVVELTVAAVEKELRDGGDCTLAWFDRRADGGVFCFTLHDLSDFEAVFRLFATAPLCPGENDVSRLSGLMNDAQDVKQIYVTASLSPDAVRRLCDMPSVGSAAGAAEVIFYNPESRFADRELRRLYIEGCREQLFSKGLTLTECTTLTGGVENG